MARIKQPQLPAGTLNDFFTALHDLHLKAGYPSTRVIQKDIGRELTSHTTIHKAFSGPRLLGWEIVELLVESLADRSRQDRDAVIEHFKSLWESAAKSPQASGEVDADKVRFAAQAVRETIPHQSERPFQELMIGTLDEIEAVAARVIGRELVPTGFSDVDILTGGMRPGSLIVIASQPSIGKSMLLIAICAKTAVRYALPTAIYSNEMREREIQVRILSAESRVPHHSLRSGMMQEDDWKRLATRMGETAKAPLWLSYSPRLNIGDLEDKARALTNKRQLRLIAIDNADALMLATNEPEEVLYRIKQLAAELQVPILMTAQMRKPSKSSLHVVPKMGELRHAEVIEAIADILILLSRPDAYDAESPRAGEIDLHFVKNRHGPTATVTLAFQGHYCRIVDLIISDELPLDWSLKDAKDTVVKTTAEDADDEQK